MHIRGISRPRPLRHHLHELMRCSSTFNCAANKNATCATMTSPRERFSCAGGLIRAIVWLRWRSKLSSPFLFGRATSYRILGPKQIIPISEKGKGHEIFCRTTGLRVWFLQRIGTAARGLPDRRAESKMPSSSWRISPPWYSSTILGAGTRRTPRAPQIAYLTSHPQLSRSDVHGPRFVEMFLFPFISRNTLLCDKSSRRDDECLCGAGTLLRLSFVELGWR